MFRKILVANRGEIAIPAFRAAHELGITSAALYTPDDRGSLHRVKADESREIGEVGYALRGYLDTELVLRPAAAHTLVERLRNEFDLPCHLHTHDTAGGQLATYMAAIDAGVDAVDGAAAPLAGTTSQPSLAAIDHTPRSTGLSLDALLDLEPYWEAVRDAYAPFETGMRAPTGRLYRHEIPGGQLSNSISRR